MADKSTKNMAESLKNMASDLNDMADNLSSEANLPQVHQNLQQLDYYYQEFSLFTRITKYLQDQDPDGVEGIQEFVNSNLSDSECKGLLVIFLEKSAPTKMHLKNLLEVVCKKAAGEPGVFRWCPCECGEAYLSTNVEKEEVLDNEPMRKLGFLHDPINTS